MKPLPVPLIVLGIVASCGVSPSRIAKADQLPTAWGQVNNGLRARLIPVSAEMSEDEIDPSKRLDTFTDADDAAFVIEVENVGRDPIKLLDTRYRSRGQKLRGTPHSDWCSQFLFSLNSLDDAGRPTLRCLDPELTLGEAVVSTLDPGKLHRFLIRPARWVSAVKYRPKPGPHRISVTYHGLPRQAADILRLNQEDSPVLAAASVEVVTPAVSFEIAAAENAAQTPIRVWGEPNNGLRAAITFAPNQRSHPHGTRPSLELYVQNVSKRLITIPATLVLSEFKVGMTDDGGKIVKVDQAHYLGIRVVTRVTLREKQIAIFQAGNIGILSAPKDIDAFRGKTHMRMVALPGDYHLQLSKDVGSSILRKDRQGKILAPLAGDWKGQLTTGRTPFTIVEAQADAKAE
ncbi:MAG: hypothetical protein O3A00_00745 [Planctomycetota bacterium]|nr:hypothetical protein [Planctomycetota bacterium]